MNDTNDTHNVRIEFRARRDLADRMDGGAHWLRATRSEWLRVAVELALAHQTVGHLEHREDLPREHRSVLEDARNAIVQHETSLRSHRPLVSTA